MYHAAFVCPSCGSEIEVSDTTIWDVDDFQYDNRQFRIDTSIRHKNMIMTEDCVVIFRMFADEQKKMVEDMLKRMADRFNVGASQK